MTELYDIEALKTLAREIKNALRQEIATAPFDKSSKGVITALNGGKYSVLLSNGSSISVNADAAHTVGEQVNVVIPQNDTSNAYISSSSESGSGGTLIDKQINFFANIYEFPSVGNPNIVYVTTSDNKIYRWDDVGIKYEIVGSNYEDIVQINGGQA